MTEPGSPRGHRAEQQALVDPTRGPTAWTPTRRPSGVPEADMLDQQLVARPRGTGGPVGPVGDREADAADVLEQEIDVPVGEDDAEE